jgi:hypothetical protein
MPAIRSLRRFQAGIETTRGTPTEATRVLRGSVKLTEQRTTYRPEYPFGARATTGGVGVIVQQATQVEVDTDLTPEEVLWPLLCGLRGSVTPTGTTPKIWTFEPSLGSADEATINTMTIEYADTDGGANQYLVGASYVVATKISISVQPGEVAKLKWSGIGRARQAITPTPGLSGYSPRSLLPGSLWSVTWDSSWAALGTTTLSTTIRSAEIEIETGWDADYLLDARPTLDYSALKPGLVKATAKLSLEVNAVAAGRITAWRSNSPAFVRLAGAADANHSVQIDLSARLGDDLSIGEDGDVVTCDLTLEGVLDTTSGKMLSIVCKNDLAAV